MLLSMSWIQPPEELTLGSKLSENCPMSRSNFAQYIWDTYIYTMIIKCTCKLQHLQECAYYEFAVYVICILSNPSGTEISDLNITSGSSSTRRRRFVCLCAHYEMLVSMHGLAETANILVYIFTNL